MRLKRIWHRIVNSVLCLRTDGFLEQPSTIHHTSHGWDRVGAFEIRNHLRHQKYVQGFRNPPNQWGWVYYETLRYSGADKEQMCSLAGKTSKSEGDEAVSGHVSSKKAGFLRVRFICSLVYSACDAGVTWHVAGPRLAEWGRLCQHAHFDLPCWQWNTWERDFQIRGPAWESPDTRPGTKHTDTNVKDTNQRK